MIGIAQPHQGREEDAAGERLPGTPDNFAQQQAVGEDGQVVSMLFQRRDGKHHRGVL